ncbi:hypothetical protein KAR91_33185 [Candidatus Pacearchaeota archaeon]|nr:hypothetical protein [Candidatus Pacearchaeota archaeon]
MLLNLSPVHRTPMDKDGGRALNTYAKKIERMLDGFTPWRKRRGWARGLAKGKVKPGEIMVVLEDGDMPNDPLFLDANTTRE